VVVAFASGADINLWVSTVAGYIYMPFSRPKAMTKVQNCDPTAKESSWWLITRDCTLSDCRP